MISVQSLILTIMRQQMQRLSYGDAEDEDEDEDEDDDTTSGLERSEPRASLNRKVKEQESE